MPRKIRPDLLCRILAPLLVPLRLVLLRVESRPRLARIAREHHLEIVRRQAWLLSGAFTAGEGTYFNPGILVVVESWGDLVADIGRRVAISPGVIFVSASAPNVSHLLGIPGFQRRYVKKGTIRVGDDAWLGAGSIILPGVSIGTGAIVGAGAVVTKDVPDWALVAGIPARIMGDVRSCGSPADSRQG